MRIRMIVGLWLMVFVLLAGRVAAAPATPFPDVGAGTKITLPADHGAHPAFHTEWWYVTGWLDSGGESYGFQVTFFRIRTSTNDENPSAFAPKQILLAHAALSDPRVGHMLHDQKIARAGFGLAESATTNTDVVMDDWSIKRNADGQFHTVIPAKDFAFDLTFKETQAPLLEGDNGYSQKGPDPKEASYYYSLPHLAVTGRLSREGRDVTVKGEAWFDHEWSSSYLTPKAVGWDWVGLNLDDGSAVMAFVIRNAEGGTVWGGGTLRGPDGKTVRLGPNDTSFAFTRRWRSTHTGAEYPMEPTLTLRLPSGERHWVLKPLLDDQELDSRAGGGPVYWEGAVTTDGGRGYLELTGYFKPLKM